jgi:hypothetical protein
VTRHRSAVPLLVLAGALAGVAAKAADASPWRWAEDLGHYPAAWLLAVAVVARWSPTTTGAAARSAVFFAVMTAAYYGWADLVQGAGPGTWRLAAVWWALSATAVPAYSVLVRAAAVDVRAAPVAGAVLALAGGLALAEGATPDRPVQLVASVVVALLITCALPAEHRTRARALVLLVPGALVASAALAAVRGAHLLP